MLQVNLMHVFLVGPILFGIGYKERGEYMELYNYLAMLSAMMIFIVRIPKNFNSRDYLRLFHIVGLTLLFGWIAYKKDTSPEFVYHIIKLLGIAVITIHLYLAITKIFKST